MIDSKQKIVKSSIIQAYSYDSNTATLSITFKNGTEFDYMNITQPVIDQVFNTSGSIGSKFIRLIRSGGYKALKTS